MQAATIRNAFKNSQDNKIKTVCSIDIKESMNKCAINFQLDPPNMYRQNSLEHAIGNCKKPFPGFTTTDPDLPICKCDRLLFQCLFNPSLLQNDIVNPSLSAYAYLYRP